MDKLNNYVFQKNQVGYITECVEPISGFMPLRDALGYFDEDSDLNVLLVELESGYGILSRNLFANKKVSMLNMNKPLSSQDLFQGALENFNSRDNVQKIFRPIAGEKGTDQKFYVVYHNNNLFGVVSLDHILRHFSDLQKTNVLRATEMQHRILENNIIRDPDFNIQADIHWAQELGGDHYYSTRISDELSMICCFDVTGNHISASMICIMIDSYFKTRTLLDNLDKEDVEKLILTLNSFLLNQIPPDCSVKAIFLFIRKDEEKVYIYNFGYTSPFLFLSEEGKTSAKMALPQYSPLGTEDIVIFREEPLVYNRSCIRNIFVYSEGLKECVNSFGEHFGMDRIKDCVVKNFKSLGDGFSKVLWEDIDAFRHETPLPEDITTVEISFS